MAEIMDIEKVKEGQIDHIGVDLWRADHSFQRLLLASMVQLGYTDISGAFSNLLPHMDLEGTRPSLLAQRMGITKQAVGQAVRELENLDYVATIPDPEDGRAKRICYTDKGLRFIRDAQAVKQRYDYALARAIGGAKLDELKSMLKQMADWAEDLDGPL